MNTPINESPLRETLHNCPVCDNADIPTIDPIANLSRCNTCEFVFANPRPTPEALAAYYSKPSKYDAWLAEEPERDKLWQRRLKLMKRWKKTGSLLDVGTGIGQLLAHARSVFSEVQGTEISDSAIALSQKKFNLPLIKGQLEELRFETQFDNISLFHILEHVPNPKSFLAKCHSLLREKGRVFIAVPNDLFSWELKLRTAMKKWKGELPEGKGKFGLARIQLDGSVDEIHLSQFTPKSLAALLQKSGFQVISNTLDPYFAKKGVKLWAHQLYYLAHLALNRLFRINRYNTILVIAQKI